VYSILFSTIGNELINAPFGININVLFAFVPLNLDSKVKYFLEEQEDKHIIETSNNRIILFIVDTSF
jgi:hypothetical protein